VPSHLWIVNIYIREWLWLCYSCECEYQFSGKLIFTNICSCNTQLKFQSSIVNLGLFNTSPLWNHNTLHLHLRDIFALATVWQVEHSKCDGPSNSWTCNTRACMSLRQCLNSQDNIKVSSATHWWLLNPRILNVFTEYSYSWILLTKQWIFAINIRTNANINF
jgi:hypothetical protein